MHLKSFVVLFFPFLTLGEVTYPSVRRRPLQSTSSKPFTHVNETLTSIGNSGESVTMASASYQMPSPDVYFNSRAFNRHQLPSATAPLSLETVTHGPVLTAGVTYGPSEESNPFIHEPNDRVSRDNLTSLDTRQTIYLSESGRPTRPLLAYTNNVQDNSMVILKHPYDRSHHSHQRVINFIDKPVYRDTNTRVRYVKKRIVPRGSLITPLNTVIRPIFHRQSYHDGPSQLNHHHNHYVTDRYENPYSNIPGTPWIDYPLYSQVPFTGFSCKLTQFPGFYADIDAGCQAWHYCQLDGRHDKFLCPNGTLFNQQSRVCDWWYNVDCPSSIWKYNVNSDLYRVHRRHHHHHHHPPPPIHHYPPAPQERVQYHHQFHSEEERFNDAHVLHLSPTQHHHTPQLQLHTPVYTDSLFVKKKSQHPSISGQVVAPLVPSTVKQVDPLHLQPSQPVNHLKERMHSVLDDRGHNTPVIAARNSQYHPSHHGAGRPKMFGERLSFRGKPI